MKCCSLDFSDLKFYQTTRWHVLCFYFLSLHLSSRFFLMMKISTLIYILTDSVFSISRSQFIVGKAKDYWECLSSMLIGQLRICFGLFFTIFCDVMVVFGKEPIFLDVIKRYFHSCGILKLVKLSLTFSSRLVA